MAAATNIPIASLEPGLDADSTSITGIVTLIWPYASSTRTFSLLLVDPDFRLRRKCGQVRIYFTGASAKAVVRAHIIGGDQLLLNLNGVRWAKDGSTAITPGKGIEWELRYGERVVLQIQRADQQPISLNIDNPTLSPEPPEQTHTPRFSPPYNSHIPTTVQKRQLNAQAWESPAFLKRSSQFAASAYDPFAEEDFPDNDRKKRTKFGRGSDQWRFADRTPSPEKETETNAIDILSLSKLPGQHRKPEKEVESPVETVQETEIHEVNGSGNGAPVSSTEDVEKPASLIPSSPPTTKAETTEIDLEVKPALRAPQTVSVNSTASSSPHSRLDGPESDSQDEEGSEVEVSDSAALSAPTSEFGLDGSVFSRTAKEKAHPEEEIDEAAHPREVDNKLNELPSRDSSLPPEIKPHATDEAVITQQATIPESSHEFLLPDGDDSYLMSTVHDHQQAAQFRSSPILACSDHLESDQVPELESNSSEEMSDEEEQFNGIADKLSLEKQEQSGSSQGTEEQKSPTAIESVSEEEMSDQEEQPTLMQMDVQEEDKSFPQNKLAAHVKEFAAGQRQEASYEIREPEFKYTETKPSTVEIIDLESDDEEDAKILGNQTSAQPISGHLDPSIETKEELVESVGQLENYVEETTAGARTAPEPKDKATTDEQKGETFRPDMHVAKIVIVDDANLKPQNQDIPAAEKTPAEQLPEVETSQKATIDAPKGETFRPDIHVDEIVVVDDDASLNAQNQDLPATEKATTGQPPKIGIPQEAAFLKELPSTVPETFVDHPSKSQLMTPDDTQQTSFASQPSFNSLQSEQDDDDTLSAPNLTQEISIGAVPSESSAYQPSQGIEVRESSPMQQETLTIRKTRRSTPQTAEEEMPVAEKRTLTQQRITRSTRRKLEQARSSPEKVRTPQKPPSFIEKLKAMRKLSAQSPRRVSDSSATSPWFAPKRSSQVVPDSEAESEAESSSERDSDFLNQKPSVVVHTPKKSKPLAASFIRTPSQQTPQRNAIASMQSSPGYLSPSQPPPPGFRTNISYYVPLTTLTSRFSTIVDILAVVLSSTSITRATAGPKDYGQTIYITDPAACRQTPNTPVITAQIFRPNNKCFPIAEKGDAILLRDFKVQTFNRQAILLSTKSSAWAVFRRSAPLEVQIRGPPVELGPEERMFAQGLWRWRDNTTQPDKDMLDEKVPKEPLNLQNGPTSKAKTAVKKTAPRTKQANNNNATDAKIKEEDTKELGAPGSQPKTRKATRERSVEMDTVKESTEPPQRVLRPRGARGMPERSESPAKAMMRRSGTVFTGGLGEPDE